MDTEQLLALYSAIPLAVGLLAARFLKFDLKGFVGVYLLTVAGALAIHYIYLDGLYILPAAAAALAGAVAMVLLAGRMGAALSANNYASVLMGVGLFPWWAGASHGAIYVLASLLFIALMATVRNKIAMRRLGIKPVKRKRLKASLSEEDYSNLQRQAGVIFALPLAAAAAVGLLLG